MPENIQDIDKYNVYALDNAMILKIDVLACSNS